MNSKLLGGILLVVGTTIGAGMLALPVATAQLGFWWSIVLLLVGWAIMTASTFVFLEVILWMPKHANIISMAGATLGKMGQAVAWVVYLVLLYSILSAYVAGGGDLFHFLLTKSGIPVSLPIASIIFTSLFGVIVYFGIRAVDYVNRGLMFGKMGTYALLVLLILPFISAGNLSQGEFSHLASPTGITVTTLAFSFLMIVPSLRTYFGDDVKALKKAIFIGTLIPLVCYIFWDMVIMGIIPLNGTMGLIAIGQSSSSNSELLISLTSILQKDSVTLFAKFFTSICMATSFLSVSLSLSDFLADGFNVKKQGLGNGLVFGLTFLPPVIFVFCFPGAFLMGLNFAGICCFILMIMLPALMAWRGREIYAVANSNGEALFQMGGGKLLLGSLIIFSIMMTIFGVYSLF